MKKALEHIPELDKLNLANTRLTKVGADKIFSRIEAGTLPKEIDVSNNLLR